MDNLTTKQVSYLNYIGRNFPLGTKLKEIIDNFALVMTNDTPVNGRLASKALAITGVSIDSETITINNPLITGSDVFEFLADTAQTKTAPGNIAVNITAYTVKASGTLTVDTRPTSGDTMLIGAKTFTFVPNGTANAEGEVAIGADLAGAKANIIAAINGTDGWNTPHPLVTIGAFDQSDDAVVTALIGGTAGNAIDTEETFTAETNVFGAGHLASGANCSAANTVTALLAAAVGTQHVELSQGDGNSVVFTATDGGIVGNDIEIAETMANGAFAGAAVKLSGGVDGTVSAGNEVRSDGTYLYVCVDPNTKADANWRRIDLGSAF